MKASKLRNEARFKGEERNPLDPFFHQQSHLELGQMLSRTKMRAPPEGDVRMIGTIDVEAIDIGQ